MNGNYTVVSLNDLEPTSEQPEVELVEFETSAYNESEVLAKELKSLPENPVNEPQNHSAKTRTCPGAMPDKTVFAIVGAVVGVAAFLLVIILPMSFQSLEYHQVGFKRRKTTGEIDRSHVYGPGGKYALGPDYEFRVFPADAHFETFERVTVFAADRLQVTITGNLQYFIRKHQLDLLHKKYDIQYRPILKNNAIDALKNAATQYTTRQFIRERERVEKALNDGIRERLSGKCCELGCGDKTPCIPGCTRYERCTEADYGFFVDLRYFQLHELAIPSDLEDKFLRGLILQEETETEEFKQEAQIVRKETDAKVQEIDNEAREISQNAVATSALIVSVASANATAIVETSRSNGLKHLYSELSITDQQHKASFDYLRTLKGQEKVFLAVDYQQLIAGPMSKVP